jgi:hypothetical protein
MCQKLVDFVVPWRQCGRRLLSKTAGLQICQSVIIHSTFIKYVISAKCGLVPSEVSTPVGVTRIL